MREVVAPRVVIRQYLVELVETIGVEPFERGGGPSVEDAAASLQEAVVRDLLRQTVPETVRALGALARLVEKLQSLELLEPQHGRSVTFPRRFEQTLREIPAEHRCGLERPFRRGVKTVDPCRDDLLNRPWHVDGSSFRAPLRAACASSSRKSGLPSARLTIVRATSSPATGSVSRFRTRCMLSASIKARSASCVTNDLPINGAP